MRQLGALALLLATILRTDAVETTDVFETKPEKVPYYVKENEQGPLLTCSLKAPYNDRNKFEVSWTRLHNGQVRHISRNDLLYEKEHFELQSDAATGAYNLKIRKVSRSHVEGSYQCSVLSAGDQFSTSAVVIALVAPGEPVVTEFPSESVKEGETVTLKCSSEGGSPQPTFTWTFPNGSSAEESHVTTQSSEDLTTSILHFRVNSEDNGAYVTCSVTNKAIENEFKEAKSPRLNILFKPQVHVEPVQELTVEEGEPLTLTCSSLANPSPPSYEWKHILTGERYAAAKWPMTAERAMSGDYECRAWNSVGGGNDHLNLNVQYKPVVTVKDHINPSAGERVEIECEVDANPRSTNIQWTGPEGYVSEGSTLVLNSVTRAQSGNYSCTATNFLTLYGQSGSQMRTGSAVTFVDVKRRPGKASISPTKLSVTVGETIELSCSAPDPGSPEGQIKWSSPSTGGLFGTRDHEAETLVVRNAQLADNGNYRCKAHNHLGEGEEAVIDVTVIEPARISLPLARERIYAAGDTAKGLDCEAQGYPGPNIVWLKNGKPIDRKRYRTESTIVKTSCSDKDYCTQTVTGTLLFTQSVIWADKGNYSCVASNGATHTDPPPLSWTEVKVIHGPVILNQRFNGEGLAAAEPGSSAHVKCIVSGRPAPTFTWMHDSSPIDETGRYSFEMNRVADQLDEYEHVLNIADTNSKDFGSYLCRASNGKGTPAEIIVQLRETGLPQPPNEPKKLSSQANSILIGWIPGFDGGYKQSFSIEYRAENPFTGSVGQEEVVTVEVRNASLVEAVQTDGSPYWLMTYNLTGLLPLSTYYFKVRAANKKGYSLYSETIIAMTNDVDEDPHMQSPKSLKFDVTRKKIEVEPRSSADSCVQLYVSTGRTFHAAGCYPADKPISIPGGTLYKARFCSRHNKLRCSQMSPTLEATHMASSWRLTMLLPLIGLALVLVCFATVLCICCRTRSPAKAVKKSTFAPQAISAMPQNEVKNAIVHGSQTDSGVFTLDSTRLKPNNTPANAYSSSSEDGNADKWPNEPYDVSHDSYLNEQPQLFQGADDRVEEQSLSENEDEDGRRIMREIIV